MLPVAVAVMAAAVVVAVAVVAVVPLEEPPLSVSTESTHRIAWRTDQCAGGNVSTPAHEVVGLTESRTTRTRAASP